ncbi:MAG: helix-turn-helix domain-containing protein [Methanolobus sp.]|nr:helix-turn-helix domain-containing protein [Methanolobus sp.]
MGDNEENGTSEKVLILPLSEDSRKITQLLSNEKAMKMLEILADRPMSASDVAEMLDMPLTTVKYNLDGLIEADLIKVKETKWSRKGREVKIYEPVQKLIVVAPGSMKNDRSSILSMLKKYLGLVAGAVFAATGLEAIARSLGIGLAPSPTSQDATAFPANNDAGPMAAMARDSFEEELMDEGIDDAFTGNGMPMEESPSPEEAALSTEHEIPAGSESYDVLPADDLGPEALVSSAPNGSDAGVDVLKEGVRTTAENHTAQVPASSNFSDNMTALTEPVSGIFQHDIFSYVSVWFFFGCIFVIALLFIREMYYRKKDI